MWRPVCKWKETCSEQIGFSEWEVSILKPELLCTLGSEEVNAGRVAAPPRGE